MQLAFKTLPKLASKKQRHKARRCCPLAHEPSASHAGKQHHAACPQRRSAFGALVSFIVVPQSIEVPHSRNLPLFELFLNPPFDPCSKTNTQAARAATAARCHLKLPLPREPQMTTQIPFPGEHYRQPVMDIVDAGFTRPLFRRSSLLGA